MHATSLVPPLYSTPTTSFRPALGLFIPNDQHRFLRVALTAYMCKDVAMVVLGYVCREDTFVAVVAENTLVGNKARRRAGWRKQKRVFKDWAAAR